MITDEVLTTISPYIKSNEPIVNSTRLDDIGVDSARLVDIVLDLEDRFKIKIQDEEFDTLNTVGDVIECVQSKQQQLAG